jgi:hypothetical protein
VAYKNREPLLTVRQGVVTHRVTYLRTLRNIEKGPKKPVSYVEERLKLKVVVARKIVPIMPLANASYHRIHYL